MWKNNQFLSLYQENLQNIFNGKTYDGNNTDEQIDFLHNNLKESAYCAYLNIKSTQQHEIQTKPWWSKQLSKLKKDLSFFYNQWKQTNFSYQPENVYYGRYKYACKIFRKAVKTAQNSHSSNH